MVEVNSNKNEFLAEIERFALDEYKEFLVYTKLASIERNPWRRDLLSKLAKQEEEHHLFWRKFVEVNIPKHYVLSAYLLILLRYIFGIVFVAKLLERHEKHAIDKYRKFLDKLEGEDRIMLEKIIKDEEIHESGLISQIDETIVKYMGALVLGLSDAIIEITGAHAGALGTTNSTILAGVIGIIVGGSAAISMASASYLQAKHETGKSPMITAAVTGIGYAAAVLLMSLPYFLLHDVMTAFFASVLIAVALAFAFTFQGSIYADRDFKPEFAQTVGLLLGTALLAYFLGDVLGSYFNIRD